MRAASHVGGQIDHLRAPGRRSCPHDAAGPVGRRGGGRGVAVAGCAQAGRPRRPRRAPPPATGDPAPASTATRRGGRARPPRLLRRADRRGPPSPARVPPPPRRRPGQRRRARDARPPRPAPTPTTATRGPPAPPSAARSRAPPTSSPSTSPPPRRPTSPPNSSSSPCRAPSARRPRSTSSATASPTGPPIPRGDPYALRSLVQIDAPADGTSTASPVTVTGEAAVFEATLHWTVLSGATTVRTGVTSTAEGQTFAALPVLPRPPARPLHRADQRGRPVRRRGQARAHRRPDGDGHLTGVAGPPGFPATRAGRVLPRGDGGDAGRSRSA